MTNMHAGRRAVWLSTVAMLAIGLGACSAGSGAKTAGGTVTSTGTTNEAAPPEPVPTIAVNPSDGARAVRLDAPVTVTADAGKLDSVSLHSDADPTPLPGTLSKDGRSWTLGSPLDPASHYTIDATAHDGGGSSSARSAFSTIPVPSRLTTDVAPADGSTVGIGMPVMLRFSDPVAPEKQAGLLSHIEVKTAPEVQGAWHWFGPSEVHWRPKDLWPAHTQVTVTGHLRGVDAGNNVWGLGEWSTTFTIGDKHYSVIDAAAHQMQVFNNDQLLHTYPVSTGKASSPTLSGTLFVRYKLQKVRMKSTSIGIPVNAPGGYDEDVFWDTAISTDGFFIHSAPWSVGSQGFANVSHGCVNLSEARAIEFFNFSVLGDVVVVKNTSRIADYSDGEADWQIPWDQWANGNQPAAQPTPPPANQGGGI